MSNIPNSAMPHAYAHDDEDEAPSVEQAGITLYGLAIAGGIAALVYFVFLRK